MVNIKINNKELTVAKDLTILQAASLANIQIPRFCYHEKLTIAGNCRMCLVEMAKVMKPVASCAMPVSEGMQVYTNSVLVKKAREGVLELLLANHPLDCPICDQGGECDLQEQAMIFGNDRSRFYELKRAVSDKTISPFVKTIMTRCIHCTRCVRFLTEVAGVNELGITGRGSSSEIGTYVKNSISSEISGNIIDLCPVGALTSKPYAFLARPWELRSTETIDLFDCLGTNIKVDTRGPNLMRILPKINNNLNEEWITDKTRFSFDGYKAQRLNTPMYSVKISYCFSFANSRIFEKTTKFLSIDWQNALLVFKEFFSLYKNCQNSTTQIVVGNQVNLECMTLLNELKYSLDFDHLSSQYIHSFKNNNNSNSDIQSSYLFNITPSTLETVDVCLLVGTNLRIENPLLNSRLRKAFLSNNAQIASVGPVTTSNSTYSLKKLGNSSKTVLKILEGKHSFSPVLLNAKNPIIILGENASFLLESVENFVKNKKIKVCLLSTYIGQNIQHELNINTFHFNKNNNFDKRKSFTFLIQADELVLSENSNNFIVYNGYQADRSAGISDLILPCNNHLEEESSYFDINSEVVKTNICLPSPTGSRTSWKILTAIFNTFEKQIRKDITFYKRKLFVLNNLVKKEKNSVNFPNVMFNNTITNFYKTNSVSRNSRVMSQITNNVIMKIKNNNLV